MQEIITRHLNHEASPQEEAELSAWLKESDANRHEYELTVRLWNESFKLANAETFDVQGAWKILDEKIQKKIPEKNISESPRIRYRKALMAAAIIFIVFTGVLFYFFNKKNDLTNTSVDASASNMKIALPDGSIVLLRQGSQLAYGTDFGKKERNVVLKGEAYFSVTHNDQLPFRVDFNKNMIQVVGTSFLLRSHDSTSEVFVESGKVRFADGRDPNHAIILSAGEKSSFNGTVFDNGKIIDSNFLSWQRGILEFNNVSLGDMVNELNQYYKVNINMSKDLFAKSDTLKVNFRFEKTSLNEALEEIHLATGIVIEHDKENILLRLK
ncbi:MAG: FecR domain-containing protein [Bacteroidetes bacterium]|nr:FecR domain-containing protein [Bacteroidota bacterium]